MNMTKRINNEEKPISENKNRAHRERDVKLIIMSERERVIDRGMEPDKQRQKNYNDRIEEIIVWSETNIYLN